MADAEQLTDSTEAVTSADTLRLVIADKSLSQTDSVVQARIINPNDYDVSYGQESTIESVNKACDMRIEKAKKELGADKGIYLSCMNFWAMITLTIYSLTIATFAVAYLCDWSKLWAEVKIPFMFLLAIAISVGLLIWTNIRDFKIPKY